MFEWLRWIIDRVLGLALGTGRGRAALAADLRPLLVQARDFFSDAVAQGGTTSDDMISNWGPIERRLEEFEVKDKKLRQQTEAMVASAKEAFAIAPAPWLVFIVDGRLPSPEEQEYWRKRAETIDPCRKAEQHAVATLRRLSRLVGRAH